MAIVDIDKRFKTLREARTLAIIALAFYKKTGNPTFLNLNEDDPPDGYLWRASKETYGHAEILNVEITHYFKKRGESLLEQLKRTKTPKVSILGSNYLLVVELRTTDVINYEEIKDYLNSINNPFPVWTLKPIQFSPDTVAEIVTINPQINKMQVNVGEAAYLWNQNKIPNVLRVQRAAKVGDVRYERLKEKIEIKPLWEIETESLLEKMKK